jgi:predicted TIM-barrel fold metal-dependent hydrolase
MRSGYKVFDADTHIQPSVETLEQYLDPQVRDLVPDRLETKVPIRIGLAGEVRPEPYRHMYRLGGGGGGAGWGSGKPRILGEAAPRENAERHFQQFMGSKFPTDGGQDWSGEVRLQDMDEEGVDVHMMVPSGANGHRNPEVEIGFIRANHRYLHEFCSVSPHRLKSLIVASSRCVDESVKEIRRWAREPWAVGVQAYFPLDYPLDHPDVNPIWEAAADEGLTIVHHSFAGGYPGYRDLWDNPFIGRTASHPWAAMRAVSAFFGSGIMDRYPALRFAILESGFGWLPFWAKRMDDQAIYMGTVAEGLKMKPSEYMTSGRFFASIVLHEGPEMIHMVSELLGDHLLMFGSDYPHAESRFPESADKVIGWEGLNETLLQNLLWENPVRCFGEP